MSSVVFSTQDQNITIPSIFYIDTNAVAELGLARKYQPDVASFLSRAAANQSVIAYSDHMLDELLDLTHIRVLQDEVSRTNFVHNRRIRKAPYKQYEDTGVNVGPLVSLRYSHMVNLLLGQPNLFTRVENPPTLAWRLRTERYRENGLAPKDARHAAIMHYYGLNDILTLDGGFARAPHLNVYGPNPSVTQHIIPGNNTPNPFNSTVP